MHYCMATNSESDQNPMSHCCGIIAGDNTPLGACPKCGQLAIWECGDCGDAVWTPKALRLAATN